MPTYAYRCESCAHQYEKREGFDAPARQKCPECGKRAAQRVLFAPPVVFKGSGFYKTDSRGSGSGESASTTSSSEGDATPSTTESKPAAPSDGHGHSHGPGGHTHGSSDSSGSVETAAAS